MIYILIRLVSTCVSLLLPPVGYLSDDSATPSPYLQPSSGHGHKRKKHKGEHKVKHKKKKSKKSKHKHKHSSSSKEMVDVETIDQN